MPTFLPVGVVAPSRSAETCIIRPMKKTITIAIQIQRIVVLL